MRQLARVVTWPLTPGLLLAALASDIARDDSGLSVGASDLPVIVAMVACWMVGVVVTGRAFDQAAGWAFLGLGTAAAWSAFCDDYSELGRTDGRDVPAWQLFATLGDTSFVWWFVFMALVLQFTPPLEPRRGLARALPAVTVVTGVVFQAMALLRSTPLDPPREELTSPWAVPGLSRVAETLAAIALYALGACAIASVVVLVQAWRRSEGEARQRLLWLVAGAVPVAPAVIAAFAVSVAGHTDAAAVFLAAAMVSLVAGAGLSVLKYRLYDVERVVTESAAYAIASAAVIVVFVGVVVVISRSTPVDAGSQLPTIAATLAGVVAARVSYVWGRRAVSRRVNPARFDAVNAVRSGLAAPSADLDDLVVQALGSKTRVLYPTAGGAWVTSDGREVPPGPDVVDVRRHGMVTARLQFDPSESDPSVVEAVAAEAAAEIDNVALRAELARQVELITESRARLATAQIEERRRIERDLHDGAQQRLLAIALQLRSARLNGDGTVLEAETDRAIADLQVTVQELRDLAAGLQPAALSGGGLLAAVADMAVRSPVVLRYDVVEERYPASVEGAAWFVIAEAVTNAVRQSRPTTRHSYSTGMPSGSGTCSKTASSTYPHSCGPCTPSTPAAPCSIPRSPGAWCVRTHVPTRCSPCPSGNGRCSDSSPKAGPTPRSPTGS
ncbi:MAG TPA: histidine kinase [Kribbellaceae bacterium]|nr:histidine kinase [Kribbellaceae bacterium]